MTIHEIAPSPELAEFVDGYWWNEGDSSGTVRILPDGCADVVFDPKGAFVVGAMTPPLRIDAAETVGAFVIRFKPGRAAVALQTPLTLLTDAHLGRTFAHHVGVTPKTFARVMRFRRAIELGKRQQWADVAAELGYFDQSHLIADFREFAGETPVPFFLSHAD